MPIAIKLIYMEDQMSIKKENEEPEMPPIGLASINTGPYYIPAPIDPSPIKDDSEHGEYTEKEIKNRIEYLNAYIEKLKTEENV